MKMLRRLFWRLQAAWLSAELRDADLRVREAARRLRWAEEYEWRVSNDLEDSRRKADA